jgi:hypothetical protein
MESWFSKRINGSYCRGCGAGSKRWNCRQWGKSKRALLILPAPDTLPLPPGSPLPLWSLLSFLIHSPLLTFLFCSLFPHATSLSVLPTVSSYLTEHNNELKYIFINLYLWTRLEILCFSFC